MKKDNRASTTQAKETAFRLLKIRGRSEKELESRLQLKGFSDETIAETVEYLKRTKLIDDRQFTKSWINARLNKPFGLRRIAFELQKKGIAKELIEEGISNAKDVFDETQVVENLTKRRAARYGAIDKEKLRRRVFEFLARRGFSIETIQKSVQKL